MVKNVRKKFYKLSVIELRIESRHLDSLLYNWRHYSISYLLNVLN